MRADIVAVFRTTSCYDKLSIPSSPKTLASSPADREPCDARRGTRPLPDVRSRLPHVPDRTPKNWPTRRRRPPARTSGRVVAPGTSPGRSRPGRHRAQDGRSRGGAVDLDVDRRPEVVGCHERIRFRATSAGRASRAGMNSHTADRSASSPPGSRSRSVRAIRSVPSALVRVTPGRVEQERGGRAWLSGDPT